MFMFIGLPIDSGGIYHRQLPRNKRGRSCLVFRKERRRLIVHARLNLQSWLPKEYHADINPLLVGFGQVKLQQCCKSTFDDIPFDRSYVCRWDLNVGPVFCHRVVYAPARSKAK